MKFPVLLTAHCRLELVYNEAAPSVSESSLNLVPSADTCSAPPHLIENEATRQIILFLNLNLKVLQLLIAKPYSFFFCISSRNLSYETYLRIFLEKYLPDKFMHML